jgi:hypothetical protein
MCIFPVLLAVFSGRNPVSFKQVLLLQANNVISNTTEDCVYLQNAVQSWLKSVAVLALPSHLTDKYNGGVYVAWAQLLPVRCDWQRQDGVITFCSDDLGLCRYWDNAATESAVSKLGYAETLGLREGVFVEIAKQTIGPADFNDGNITADFYVKAIFNESHTIALT